MPGTTQNRGSSEVALRRTGERAPTSGGGPAQLRLPVACRNGASGGQHFCFLGLCFGLVFIFIEATHSFESQIVLVLRVITMRQGAFPTPHSPQASLLCLALCSSPPLFQTTRLYGSFFLFFLKTLATLAVAFLGQKVRTELS